MRTPRSLVLALALAAPACSTDPASPSSGTAGHAAARPAPAGPAAPATPRAGAAQVKARLAAAGATASDVAPDGTPRLIWATAPRPAPVGASPEAAARAHLAAFAPAFGVPRAAIDALRLQRVHTLHGGARVAIFRPQVAGLEVYRGDVKVLMRADGSLVAISGAPRRDAVTSARMRAGAFRLTAADALAIALADHTGAPVTAGDVVARPADRHGDLRLDLRAGAPLALPRTARARRVLLAQGPRLVPSWWIEAWGPRKGGDPTELGVFDAVVDAGAGQVLVREDRTASDAFSYRVWTDGADKRPLDGPIEDFTPHPTGMPDGSTPAFATPGLVSMEGFNKNPDGNPDPWLAPGATQSRGNNIDAYTDDDSPDGFSTGDIRATTTAAGTFDRTYDLAAGPETSDDQKMAAIVQAFYTTNWLHDWWYDSGFDEAAGNAQADNFGRGGLDADPMHVEVQDGAGQGNRNNANMSAGADGDSPRMQMYLWSGEDNSSAELTPGGILDTLGADFGLPGFDVTKNVIVADDGTGTTSDGCEAIANTVTGMVVLVDRGSCTFKQKAVNAEAAGAAALIIANNQAGAGPMPMSDGTPTGTVGIGVLSVSMEDGAAIKAVAGQRRGVGPPHPGRLGRARRRPRQHRRRPRVGPLPPPAPGVVRPVPVQRDERGLGRLQRADDGAARGRRPRRHLRDRRSTRPPASARPTTASGARPTPTT